MSSQEINQNIAHNLCNLLDQRNKTQLELAEFMNVSQATVSNWCKGLKLPRMDKIDRICDFFGIQRIDLLGNAYYDRFSAENSILAAKVAKTPELRELVNLYLSSDETGKSKILDNAKDISRLYPNDDFEKSK